MEVQLAWTLEFQARFLSPEEIGVSRGGPYPHFPSRNDQSPRNKTQQPLGSQGRILPSMASQMGWWEKNHGDNLCGKSTHYRKGNHPKGVRSGCHSSEGTGETISHVQAEFFRNTGLYLLLPLGTRKSPVLLLSGQSRLSPFAPFFREGMEHNERRETETTQVPTSYGVSRGLRVVPVSRGIDPPRF